MTRSTTRPWLAACLLVIILLVPPSLARAAAEESWSGTWETRWRDGGAALELRQDGAKVTGTYPLYDGRVEGEIVGRELRGRWFEGSRFGGFVFVLSPDGRSFMGRYDTGEWWTGERARAASFSTQVDQRTPRRTVRTFLLAGTGWREGALDEIGKAVSVVDFGPGGDSMRPGQKIEAAIDLFQAISLTTFRIWDVPGRSANEMEVRLALEQAGTGTILPLLLRRETEERWQIVMPPAEQLQRHTAALLARSGGRLPPPDEHRRLNSPRAAMQTFLAAFRDWDGAGPRQAVSTLDLSDVRGAVREHEGLLAAEYLKNVLARIGWVTLQEIPDDPNDRTPYVHFRHGAGNIVIAPQGDGADTRWRFTAETIRDLRHLYAALEDMPSEAQARPPAATSPYFAIRERFRARAPWLLGRWGSVENWQAIGAVLVVLVAAAAIALLSGAVALGARIAGRSGFGRRHRHVLWPLDAALACGILLLGTGVLGLPNTVMEVLYAVVGCVLALSIVWAGWKLIDVVSRAMSPRLQRTLTSVDDILLSLVTTAAKVALLAVGAAYVADALSIPYSGIIAGLGIGGLAVAFASKETLSNVFGAAILAADRPFRRGDWISAGATQGTVEHVGIRSTRIRTAEDSVVVVPNGKLADETINNLGTRRTRLFKVAVPLPYGEDSARLDALAADIRDMLDTRKDDVVAGKTQVGLMALRDACVELDVTCYLRVADAAEERRLRHDLILSLIDICRRDGIEAVPAVAKAA